MISSMPSAVSFQKKIQFLEYVEYLDIKNIPSNIREILEASNIADLFKHLIPFGDFYKFKDGKQYSREDDNNQMQGNTTRLL
jgi:hypothetical protein